MNEFENDISAIKAIIAERHPKLSRIEFKMFYVVDEGWKLECSAERADGKEGVVFQGAAGTIQRAMEDLLVRVALDRREDNE